MTMALMKVAGEKTATREITLEQDAFRREAIMLLLVAASKQTPVASAMTGSAVAAPTIETVVVPAPVVSVRTASVPAVSVQVASAPTFSTPCVTAPMAGTTVKHAR